MSESLGSAALYLTVETSDMTAGVERAKRSIKGLSADATAQFESATSAQKRLAESYVRTAGFVGKSTLEIKALNAEARIGGKLGAEIAAQYRKLDVSAARAAVSANKAFNGTAMSARATAAAMRGVPAQITDIFTSLAGGQRPLTVLLQQGGQLKDMFGGVVPAARALGSSLASLINPATLAAAAATALGVAWYQATERGVELNKALILTGNYAGTTADELGRMADQLDDATNATGGRATEVLAEVAATGKFTAEQMHLVSQAALAMEDATGKAARKTVEEFEALGKDPVEAILKLNEAQHFLTDETLKAIQELQNQGRTAEAAALAIRTYADTTIQRAAEVVENLGLLSGAWRDVKSAAKESWDEVVSGFGRADAAAKSGLQSISDYMQALRLPGGASAFAFGAVSSGASLSGGSAGPAKTSTVDSAAARARIAAEKEFDQLALSNLSKRESLEREIKEIKKLGVAAGKSQLEVDKQIANARARYAESLPKPKKPRAESESAIQNAKDRFNDMVGGILAELEGPMERVQQKHLTRLRELEQAAKKGKISHDDLTSALAFEAEAYKRASEEVQNRYDLEVAGLTGPIARAQADHAAAVRRINELKEEAGITGEQYNAMLAEEAERYREASIAAARAADPIGAMLEAMRENLQLIGLTNSQQALANALLDRGIDLSSDYARAKLEEAKSIDIAAEAQLRQIDLMDDFRGKASDSLVSLATDFGNAKEIAKDFFDSLARMALKAIADDWIGKLFGPQGSNGQGTSGGNWLSGLIGALFGGAGSGAGASAGNGVGPYFQQGGYTGDGPANEVAGVVHRGEYVIPAPMVRAIRNGSDGSSASSMRREVALNQTFVVQGSPDKRTREQMARTSGREASRAMARTGR